MFAVIKLTWTEIIILQIGAVILGVTIYFFLQTRRSLQRTIKKSKKQLNKVPPASSLERLPVREDALDALEKELAALKKGKSKSNKEPENKRSESAPAENLDATSIATLKDTVLRQQITLNSLLARIENMAEAEEGKLSLEEENDALKEKIERLEQELELKEVGLRKMKEQEAVAQKMAARIDDVYKEFDVLQQKIASLEKQASRANALSIELEDLRQSYDQLHKDLIRKQEKLEDAIAENQRLHQALSVTEDKLAEANLQRQQLMKKVQFLQDMNQDMQNMSESNHKLQTELRRIGELESMLNMISEERDRLLKRGSK